MKTFRNIFNYCSKMPFYSVACGRKVGVYQTWPECQAQVIGFSGSIYKKFNTKQEAEQFIVAKSYKTSVANNVSNTQKRLLSTDSSILVPIKRKRTNDDAIEHQDPSTSHPNNIIKMNNYGKYCFPEDKDGYVQVFTDGSCEGNGQANAIAGLGVFFADGHALNSARPVSGRATNNCGEIQAASLAIRLASENDIKKMCINTDSKFLIDSVTKWLPGWKRRGWTLKSGEPVKNKIDFLELDNLLQQTGMTIKWNYVKAHQGIFGNERADALAKQGGQLYKLQKKSGV